MVMFKLDAFQIDSLKVTIDLEGTDVAKISSFKGFDSSRVTILKSKFYDYICCLTLSNDCKRTEYLEFLCLNRIKEANFIQESLPSLIGFLSHLGVIIMRLRCHSYLIEGTNMCSNLGWELICLSIILSVLSGSFFCVDDIHMKGGSKYYLCVISSVLDLQFIGISVQSPLIALKSFSFYVMFTKTPLQVQVQACKNNLLAASIAILFSTFLLVILYYLISLVLFDANLYMTEYCSLFVGTSKTSPFSYVTSIYAILVHLTCSLIVVYFNHRTSVSISKVISSTIPSKNTDKVASVLMTDTVIPLMMLLPFSFLNGFSLFAFQIPDWMETNIFKFIFPLLALINNYYFFKAKLKLKISRALFEKTGKCNAKEGM